MGIDLYVCVHLMHTSKSVTQCKGIKIAAKLLWFLHSKDLHYKDKKDNRPWRKRIVGECLFCSFTGFQSPLISDHYKAKKLVIINYCCFLTFSNSCLNILWCFCLFDTWLLIQGFTGEQSLPSRKAFSSFPPKINKQHIMNEVPRMSPEIWSLTGAILCYLCIKGIARVNVTSSHLL